ncbi:MAG: phospholipase D-like domain-containing protein [Planctomycetota bacterium]
MITDIQVETGTPVEELVREAKLGLVKPQGDADVQVIPSGPGETGDGLLQMLLGVIYAAREELVLTTPYFVPDEGMLRALRGAAGRGVDVHLVVPARVDSFLVRHASRSYYDELLEAGVRIHCFRGGLLHTKSITVDGGISMFGTVNLDMRSLWLNFEVSLFVYDASFGRTLRDLQQGYIDVSDHLAPDAWKALPAGQRFLDNAVRLVSPLL